MHQSLQGATFHIEHVIPRVRGGTSELENLALACPSCNLHKADRVSFALNRDSAAVALFHPLYLSYTDSREHQRDYLISLLGFVTYPDLDYMLSVGRNHEEARQLATKRVQAIDESRFSGAKSCLGSPAKGLSLKHVSKPLQFWMKKLC
jgi:hypothetical protein